MTRFATGPSLKYLGTLRGRGILTHCISHASVVVVDFEIDGFQDRNSRSADGRIEGDAAVLARTLEAGANITLPSGDLVELLLFDPKGSSIAGKRQLDPVFR